MPKRRTTKKQMSDGHRYRPVHPSAQNGLGIAALILGIVGLLLFLLPYVGVFFSIVAIVCAFIQHRNAGKTRASSTGLVLGIIGTAVNVLMIIILIVMLIPLITTTDDGKGEDDASRYEDAIVIDAESEKDGVDKEYAYLETAGCPDRGGAAEITQQELQKKGAHMYDILHVRCHDGFRRAYYFQIDSFFGKLDSGMNLSDTTSSDG